MHKHREDWVYSQWKAATGVEKTRLLEELVGLLKKHAYSVCWLKIPDMRNEFSGVVGEAVWRAIKGEKGFSGKSLFSTWFHRIVLNECNRALVSKQRRAEVSFEEEGAEEGREISDAPILVRQLMQGLTEEEREMLLLKMNGATEEEIAEILGVSRGAVAQRWLRLKEKMADGCD